MEFLELETTTGLTTIRTAHISAVTWMEQCWEIHIYSGTIFRTSDDKNELRAWMNSNNNKGSINGIPI